MSVHTELLKNMKLRLGKGGWEGGGVTTLNSLCLQSVLGMLWLESNFRQANIVACSFCWSLFKRGLLPRRLGSGILPNIPIAKFFHNGVVEPLTGHAQAFNRERRKVPNDVGIGVYMPLLKDQVKPANNNDRQAWVDSDMVVVLCAEAE